MEGARQQREDEHVKGTTKCKTRVSKTRTYDGGKDLRNRNEDIQDNVSTVHCSIFP